HRRPGTGVRPRRRRTRCSAGDRARPTHDRTGVPPMTSCTIPNVITSHPRGERVMDVYSHLLNERIVYLGTEIDDGVANVLIAQILHLTAEDPDREIALYLNSPGGSMTSMFAVYDTMQYVRAPVSTTCVGQARSAAAILLADGAPA